MFTNDLSKVADEIQEHCDINGNFSTNDYEVKLALAKQMMQGAMALIDEVADELKED